MAVRHGVTAGSVCAATFLAVLAIPLDTALAQNRLVQPPTATEAFHLRQVCDQISQKLEAEYRANAPDIPPMKFTFSAVSHYSFSRATCYVLINQRTYQTVK